MIDYVFPFAHIERDARIVLYGAGKLGKILYGQNYLTGWCQIDAWCDVKLQGKFICGQPIVNPEQIHNYKCKYVVVAILSEQTREEVKEYLLKQGFSDKQIILIDKAIEENENLLRKYLYHNDKRAYLLNTPNHRNLGDHAIAMAVKSFLKKYYDDYEILEISDETWGTVKECMAMAVQPEDVGFITGGGFIGDLWPKENARVRDMITYFDENKVVYLPQTFFYMPDKEDSVFTADKEYYAEKGNMYWIHREHFSYEFFTSNITSRNTGLFPDMVLSLPRITQKKNGKIALCFRIDLESEMNDGMKQDMVTLIEQLGYSCVCTDTFSPERFAVSEREEKVISKIEEFATYDLVITDRLHGMVFAYLGNTPCIAINNKSKKVEGVYTWLEGYSAVRCVEYAEITTELCKSMLQTKPNDSLSLYITEEEIRMAKITRDWIEE